MKRLNYHTLSLLPPFFLKLVAPSLSVRCWATSPGAVGDGVAPMGLIRVCCIMPLWGTFATCPYRENPAQWHVGNVPHRGIMQQTLIECLVGHVSNVPLARNLCTMARWKRAPRVVGTDSKSYQTHRVYRCTPSQT